MSPTMDDWSTQIEISDRSASNGNTAFAQSYSRELRDVVSRYAARMPRTMQRHLGPSELGHECDRQIVGKMAGVSLSNASSLHDPWASFVGTAIHSILEDVFKWDAAAIDPAKLPMENGMNPGRWEAERRVTPDPASAAPHPGTGDLYDWKYKAVVDHKGIALDTPIPTPSGWTTMGDLKAGDEVLGSDGKPCRVTKVYPVQYRDCYRVEFKGDVSVTTDDVQLWEVTKDKGNSKETVLLSSKEMKEQLRTKRGQRHLRVRSVVVDLPDEKLAADPYVLGYWLGDGDSHGGQIVSADIETWENIYGRGYEVGKDLRKINDGTEKHTVFGLMPQLEELGVLKNKHIPPQYLRASYAQRLDLLRGLMDSDGSHNKVRNQCVFTSVDSGLANQVKELTASLGWKSYVCSFEAKGFGVVTTAYQVMFTPVGDNPFLLERKASRVLPKKVAGAGYRIVQEVVPVESVATQCIDVDSPDHLYLVTDQFIPTHNCQSEGVRDKLKRNGVPPHYFFQMMLYALGYVNEGFTVTRIILVSWPRTKSSMDDIYVYEHVITAKDIEDTLKLLERTQVRESLAKLVADGDLDLGNIPVVANATECAYCPFFNPRAALDPSAKGCSGTSNPEGKWNA